MDYADMKLGEICKEKGVEDLRPSVACKGKFAMALKREAQGEHERAAELLDAACAAEV